MDVDELEEGKVCPGITMPTPGQGCWCKQLGTFPLHLDKHLGMGLVLYTVDRSFVVTCNKGPCCGNLMYGIDRFRLSRVMGSR